MNEQPAVRRFSLFDPNQFIGSALLGALSGLVAGLLSGVIARASMRAVALIAGETPSFSLSGTLFIFGLGALFGALVGIAFGFLLPYLPGSFRAKGLNFGALLALLVAVPALLVDLGGELALVPRWALIGLFAPLGLVYGLVLGPVAERLAPKGRQLLAESPSFARNAGLLLIASASVGAIVEMALALRQASVVRIGYDMGNNLVDAAGGLLIVSAMAGIAGLLRSGGVGSSLLAKLGLGLSALVIAFMGLAGAAGSMGTINLHGLIRMINRVNFNPETATLLSVLLAAALGFLLAGIATLRARKWSGWRGYIPLLVGAFPFFSLLLLYPALFPALVGISVAGRAALGYWVGAAYFLLWLALGLAMRVETSSRLPAGQPEPGHDREQRPAPSV